MTISTAVNFRKIRNYQGYLLVAHPHNPQDDLAQSVVVIIKQTQNMAMGLQINNVLANVTVRDLAVTAGIDLKNLELYMPASPSPLYYGGSRNMHRVYVLHSRDWHSSSTEVINDQLAVTHDMSILTAILMGQGPKEYRVCAGHWLWADIDLELTNKNVRKWEILPSSEDLIFDLDPDTQWSHCLQQALQYNCSQWLV
jgi:putative transcriptional regulator